MGKRWRKRIDRSPSAFVQFLVVAKLREPQKIQGSDRTRRGFGAVIVVLHSEDDARLFAAGSEVAAVLFIVEQTVPRFLKLKCDLQPIVVALSFVKIQESLD